MCCFAGFVERVSGTSLYARAREGGRQLLVYEMTVAASGAVAMVLPLPVPASPAEDAVRFVDLHTLPDFFAAMRAGFPRDAPRAAAVAFGLAPMAPQALAVHDVGAFEASFVPTRADFARLDARFRLADAAWDALPAYRDWGFAVFKLKGVSSRPTRVHPMALDFPRRDPARLFFPTVHVHDGRVHPRAEFDHALYGQTAAAPAGWERSISASHAFMPHRAFTLGLLDGRQPVFRKTITGLHPNDDTWTA